MAWWEVRTGGVEQVRATHVPKKLILCQNPFYGSTFSVLHTVFVQCLRFACLLLLMASSIAGIGGTMLALADTTRGIEWRKEDMALREITERQRALENRNRAVDGMMTQALPPLLPLPPRERSCLACRH